MVWRLPWRSQLILVVKAVVSIGEKAGNRRVGGMRTVKAQSMRPVSALAWKPPDWVSRVSLETQPGARQAREISSKRVGIG